METIDIIEIIIFLTGATSIWMLAKDRSWSKWGFIIGIIGQPCWLYTTIKHEQWGLLCLTFIYTYSYCIGIYNKFIKNNGRKSVKEHN